MELTQRKAIEVILLITFFLLVGAGKPLFGYDWFTVSGVWLAIIFYSAKRVGDWIIYNKN